LEQVADAVAEVPALSLTVQRVMDACSDGATDARTVSEMILADQGLTANVLKLANSAYYGLPRRVTTVTDAVVLMGMSTVRSLAVSSHTSQLLSRPLPGYAMARGDLWRHSLAVAFVSRRLAAESGVAPVEEAFVAGLLHDLGKVGLPIHIAEPGAALSPSDMQRYQEHVGLSVDLGQRMGLSSDVLIAIAQHHEMADGSGFPLRLVGEDLSRCGQILALVNRYDRLCNPLHGEQALTPHEALARIFALRRECFDATVLGAFIRMMGVYPPGSLVQLVDGRFGLVVVVDALHSLRPCVVLYEPAVPRDEAPLLDLAQNDEVGILRSLKPAQLPRDALDYLLPRPRISYFFERALSPRDCGGSA